MFGGSVQVSGVPGCMPTGQPLSVSLLPGHHTVASCSNAARETFALDDSGGVSVVSGGGVAFGAVVPARPSAACSPGGVTIPRGVGGQVADALIATDTGADGSTTANYGATGALTASVTGTGQRQGLLRFDLSAIPQGAVVTSATATLSVIVGGGAPVSAHQAIASWQESTVTWASFGEAYLPRGRRDLPRRGYLVGRSGGAGAGVGERRGRERRRAARARRRRVDRVREQRVAHAEHAPRARGLLLPVGGLDPRAPLLDPRGPPDEERVPMTERIGLLAFWKNYDRKLYLRAAQLADDLGYDSFWLPEAWGYETFSVLTEMALATKRIKLGTGIVNVYSRSPGLVAMSAATVDEISEGRFMLGVGTSGARVIEGFHGRAFDKPLTQTRDVIRVVRTLLSGGKLHEAGAENASYRPFTLEMTPKRRAIPIYVAALKQKAIESIGELADGWIPTFWPYERLAEGKAWIAAGAARAGTRDPAASDRRPSPPCSRSGWRRAR